MEDGIRESASREADRRPIRLHPGDDLVQISAMILYDELVGWC